MLTTSTGKQWHAPKKAFRPTKGLTSYEARVKLRADQAAMKAKEKEMKEEKEAERKVGIALHKLGICRQSKLTQHLQARMEALKAKRAAKEEKERYEKIAEKMHKKRVERLKRKEKRNKLINS